MRFLALALAIALLLASPALLASGGGVPADRWVYIQPYSWCPDASGAQLEYPVLYAYGKRARLGPVAPASCAQIDGYTARTTLRLKCERSGEWSPPVIIADAQTAARFMPACHPSTAQDFR